MTTYPGLVQLLHFRLHQDWGDEYDDVWEVVDELVSEEPELARNIPSEVSAVLASIESEEGLRQLVLFDFGCDYMAEADGWTYRAWLTAVSERVERQLAQ